MSDDWSVRIRPALDLVPTGWYDLEVTEENLNKVEGERRQLILTFRLIKHPYTDRYATAALNIKPVLTPESKMAKWGAAITGEQRPRYGQGDFLGCKCRGRVETIARTGGATMLRVTDVLPMDGVKK